MDKHTLIAKVIAQLNGELELLAKAARAAHAEATDESSKAENKYDTRGLEASYLARGQSRQAAEAAQAIEDLQALPVREFAAGDEIEVSALVELAGKRERNFYFIAPRAGGTEVTLDGEEILVITPQSPLGQQLVGRKQGDKIKLTVAGNSNEFRVASVV
ncbi:MAG TPA: transcription elongation factor GreAB [Methylomirabilota bacterium]|nr:transcription elongation factor GreAB [Methylomirabilota bacterium]